MRLTSICLLGTLFATGCAQPEPVPVESQVGKNCLVYFRRDALGMAADIPSSATTGSLNGAEVTQIGQLVKASPDWIVINYHGREFHIPRTSILMIEFGNNLTQDPALGKPVEVDAGDHGGHDHH